MDNKNKLIIEESKKRFQQILEYNFAIPNPQTLEEDDEPVEDDGFPEAPTEADFEDAETPEMGEPAMDPESEAPEGDMPGPEGEMEGPEPEEEPTMEPEGEINAPGMEDEEPLEEPEAEGDEIELDVTELVQKSEDAEAASMEANEKIDQLMAQLSSLDSKIANVDGLAQQIASLEKEIEERNPSEVEKLEMRSMNSYPYNLKLTDYWADKEKELDNGEGQEFEEKEEEYVLTKDDVEQSYSDNNVKNTFDYTEEDI
jgi:hypothetical protein